MMAYVIASEAKQSRNIASGNSSGLLRRFAPRNDDEETGYLSSQTSSKRRLLYWLLSCGWKFFT